MRSSKSRPRSKNNRNNNRSAANVLNRVFDSSGPEGKVRGTPQQVIEKYQQLTRDSQLSGDRVAAENFQQHAEHYMRLQAEAQREIELRREQQEKENREKQAQRDQEKSERPERLENENPVTGISDPVDLGGAKQPNLDTANKNSSKPELVQDVEKLDFDEKNVQPSEYKRRSVRNTKKEFLATETLTSENLSDLRK